MSLKEYLFDEAVIYLNITPEIEDNQIIIPDGDLIRGLIDSAISFVSNYLKNPIIEEEVLIKRYGNYSNSALILPHFIVKDLSIKLNEVELQEGVDYYRIDCYIFFEKLEGLVNANLEISYKTGFNEEDIPKDLKEAILMLVLLSYKHRDPSVEVFSVGTDNIKINYGSIPKRVYEILDNYKIKGAF